MALQPELEKFKERFPEFTLTLRETKGPMYTQQLGSGLQVVKKCPVGFRACTWPVEVTATIELHVIANDKREETPQCVEAIYAVAPADMTLHPGQRLKLANDDKIAITWEEVGRKPTDTIYEITSKPKEYIASVTSNSKSDCPTTFDFKQPPLLCYRYWFALTFGHGDQLPVDVYRKSERKEQKRCAWHLSFALTSTSIGVKE